LNNSRQKQSGKISRTFVFPVAVLVIYAVIAFVSPDKALSAMKSSGDILFKVLPSLALIFVFMLLLNLFLNPARVSRFLGKGSGLKGVLLSIATGIISTGPIYAWYPLLKDLKAKGAEESSIAIFLYNRAIKPFLLPIMISYFGWIYTAILTILMVLASIVVGYLMNIFSPVKKK
jgi:uncharacterized membrane protein YraQ (UPF0718 family)